MILNYYKAYSASYPQLIDTASSSTSVFIRKNVIKAQSNNNTESTIGTLYEYDEAKLSKKEYHQYLQEMSLIDIQQIRADIDYIALMSGVDLGV